MKIASFCIKHKVTTILAFLIIAVFGVVFYANLKLALMPNMEFPAAYVLCTYSGAGPEDMEELVTRPLESCISTLAGVEEITSTSSENVSMVMISYADGTDVDSAAIKLREKFDALTLPEGCTDPVIYNFNVNDMMPVAMIALSGEDLTQLQTMAEDTVGPALERLDGVASVDIMGGISQQIAVEVNTTALTGYGLTLSDISNYLAAANVLYPGGNVQNGTNVLTVTTDGQFQSVEDVANTVIFLPRGGTIRLGEIASVYLESSLGGSAAKLGDADCVLLSVNKRSGSNEVETSQRILETLEELQQDYPSMTYLVPYEAGEYILQVANNAIQNIILGVVLSAAVVLAFLRRGGATVTISLSMPFCVLTVFLLMNIFGTTLNMMSLGGHRYVHRHGGRQLHCGPGEHLPLRRGRPQPIRQLCAGHVRGGHLHHRLQPDHRGRLPAHRPERRPGGHDVPGLLPDGGLPHPLLPSHRSDPGAPDVLFPAG